MGTCGKWLVLTLVVFLLSSAAGCVSPQVSPETQPVERIAAPPEMLENLQSFIDTENGLADHLRDEAANLQTLLLSGEADTQRIHAWLRGYYSQFPLIHSTLYYNAVTGERTSVLLENRNYSTFPFPEYQESDFVNKTQILTGPFYVEGDTNLITLTVPMYHTDGTYLGYWMQACDPYVVTKYMYIQSGADSSYILEIVRSDGTEVYSSRSYSIGNSINAAYPGFGLMELFRTNASGGMRYQIPYGDYFGFSKQILTETGAWMHGTFIGEPVIYMISKPENQSGITQDTIRVSNKEQLMEIVRDAVSYTKTHTQEETLDYINNQKADCRLMAFTFEGDLLADSLSQRYVGSNYRGTRDVYGVRTIRDMIYRAQHGGGFCNEYYPVEDLEVPRQTLFGHAYVLPVGDATSWFVAALSPMSKDVAEVDMSSRDAVLFPVLDVVAYVRDHGKEATLQEIRKPDAFSSAYTKGKEFWIFGIDYDGNMLASSRYPNATGVNVLKYTDIYGNSIGREMVMLAKNGGGATYLCEYDAEKNVLIYMLNVEPVGVDWFFVTAVRMDEVVL